MSPAKKAKEEEITPDAVISDDGIDQSALISDDGAAIGDEGLVIGDEGAAISDGGPVISDSGLLSDQPIAQPMMDVQPNPVPTVQAPSMGVAPGPGSMTVVDGGSSVMSAKFAPLGQPSTPQNSGSMDLLLDVNLHLSVELGRTSMPVREVLHLGPGSIVELDKLAGEPVDIMVNGKLVARGEVVVIDENFGVRVTEIASQSERLSKVV